MKVDRNILAPELEAVLHERLLEEKELELKEWLWRSDDADITIRKIERRRSCADCPPGT